MYSGTLGHSGKRMFTESELREALGNPHTIDTVRKIDIYKIGFGEYAYFKETDCKNELGQELFKRIYP